jgi:ABC-type Mn2+/Zn2+ transport system permease subunit
VPIIIDANTSPAWNEEPGTMNSIMGWLTEPFQYSFMHTALLTAVLVSVTCATLGAYVVLRRMAFIGDALAHTVLPGLVVAYLNGWSLFGGAVVAGVATALGIGWISRRETVREDTAIGILFTGMFALGIFLISRTRSFRDLTHILFGNVLSVTTSDLRITVVVAALVLVTLALLFKELELTSVDPVHAAAIGLSPDALRYILLTLLALTVVAGIQAVGVVLISALLITPAAAASLLTVRLMRMMLLATAIAVLSAVIGLYLSFYYEVSSGAAIVLVCTGFFVLAWTARTAGLVRATS